MALRNFYIFGSLTAWVLIAVFNILVLLFSLSLLTSGAKAYRKDCGKVYKIENYLVVGNLFCEDED